MNNQKACANMIKQQLRTGDVLDETILDLYHKVQRHQFVPPTYAEFAYADMHIPLPHKQCMLTPLEEGTMLQALDLQGTERVLEIGTGSGFFTAMLSKLCQEVTSIDYYASFTKDAAAVLAAHHCNNVELITGDGSQGLLEKAPFDVMVFTGALDSLNESHFLQILPGGKLLAIEGEAPIMQARLYTLDHGDQWQSKLLFETRIPLLVDKLKHTTFVF